MTECKSHDVIWDLGTMEIRRADEHAEKVGDDFDEAVEIQGKCVNCSRVFLKTYLDPRYSELKQPDNELTDAFRESIRTQNYIGNIPCKNLLS